MSVIADTFDPLLASMRDQFNAIQLAWDEVSPVTSSAFNEDLGALEGRWAVAKSVGTDEALFRALKRSGPGGRVMSGDYDDVRARLSEAGTRVGASFGDDTVYRTEPVPSEPEWVRGGMITGSHSLAQVQQFVSYYDRLIKALDDRYDVVADRWNLSDPKAAAEFKSYLVELKLKWALAHVLWAADTATTLPVIAIPVALSVLFSTVTGGTYKDAIPYEVVYQAFLHVIRQGGEGAEVVKGDYNWLNEKLSNIESVYSVNVPSPSPPGQQKNVEQSTRFTQITKGNPNPAEWLYWAQLVAAGVAVGLVLQTVGNVVAIRRELREERGK